MDDLGGKPHYFRKHPSILSKIQFPVFSKQKGGLPDGTLPLSWWAICPLKNRLKKTSRTSDPMGRPIEKSNGVNGKCKEGFPQVRDKNLYVGYWPNQVSKSCEPIFQVWMEDVEFFFCWDLGGLLQAQHPAAIGWECPKTNLQRYFRKVFFFASENLPPPPQELTLLRIQVGPSCSENPHRTFWWYFARKEAGIFFDRETARFLNPGCVGLVYFLPWGFNKSWCV